MTPQEIQDHISQNRANGYYDASWTDQAILENLQNNGFASPQDLTSYSSWNSQPRIDAPAAGPTAAGGLDLNQLVPSSNPTAPVVPPFTPVSSGGGPQGYSQNEAGAQSGGYTSVGATEQTQQGKQTQAGTERGTQTAAQTGTSTQTTAVNDPFDLTRLVGSQLGATTTQDAANRSWLEDFRDTGGTAFGSQTEQAINRSLSGPGMVGVGDSAKGRAAGYAGAEVARTNAGQRLNAADQLARPTALASTVGAVSPLLGTTTTGATTGNSTAVSDLAKNLETLDFQKLVGREAGAGTATGQSLSQGSGVAPAGQTQKAGGCVVCTAYVSRREMHPGAVRRACRYKQAHWRRYGTSLDGYLLYGPFLARAVLKSTWFARTFKPLARAILYEEVRLSAPTRLRKRWLAYTTHGAFDFLSWPVGLLSRLVGLNTGVRDEKVRAMLVEQNLNFSIPCPSQS